MKAGWHYTDLIRAHRYFDQIEGRFRFYVAFMEARDPRAWLSSADIPPKECLLLFGWVHSWDPNFQGDIVRFLNIYEQIFPEIKRFEGARIMDVELGQDVRGVLRDIFDRIADGCCRERRFESTDTSKILHAIIPELFVMWDDEIKKGILGKRTSARAYDGACYADEFLPGMQKRAWEFLDSYVEENGGDRASACRRIEEEADGHTLAKLVDELNYLMFTRGKSLAEIRMISL